MADQRDLWIPAHRRPNRRPYIDGIAGRLTFVKFPPYESQEDAPEGAAKTSPGADSLFSKLTLDSPTEQGLGSVRAGRPVYEKGETPSLEFSRLQV
jgi:hypothetical protein